MVKTTELCMPSNRTMTFIFVKSDIFACFCLVFEIQIMYQVMFIQRK